VSLKSRLKKRVRSVRSEIKRIGRKTAPIKARVIPYVTAATAGVVSYLVPGVGSALGLAISTAGAAGARYMGATAARARGIHGREAREKGRALGKKTLIAGVAGTAAGTAGALAKAYFAAPSAASTAGSASTGITLNEVLAAGSTIYSIGSKAYDIYKSRQESKEPVGAILEEPRIPALAGGGGDIEFDEAGSFQETPVESEKGGGILVLGAIALALWAAS
jgi:hypothetical protein